MIRIILSGIRGKMGQMIQQEIIKDATLSLVAGYDKEKGEQIYNETTDLPEADVLIDFSHPHNIEAILTYARDKRIPLVLGTTGYTEVDFELINKTSGDIPIFYSSNYSIGIYAMNKALAYIAPILESSFDVRMKEIHHQHKIDAPSGTAKTLVETLNSNFKTKQITKVSSIREGEIVGIHDVVFKNDSEKLLISHEAFSKGVFANGALLAAKFIINKKPKLYNMDDLFGGKK